MTDWKGQKEVKKSLYVSEYSDSKKYLDIHTQKSRALILTRIKTNQRQNIVRVAFNLA